MVVLAAATAVTVLGRALLSRLLLLRLRRDVAALNRGDHRPLLARHAEDAVLIFNRGDHRWSGEHHGKAACENWGSRPSRETGPVGIGRG